MLTTENFQPPSTLPKKNNSLHLSHWSAGFIYIYIYIYIMQYNFFFPPFFYFITSLSLAGSMPCIYLWCNTIMYSHRHVASILCESACPHYLLVPKGTPKLLVDTGTCIYFGWLGKGVVVVVVAALAVDQRWWWWWGWSTVTTMVVVLVVDHWWLWWLVIGN